MLNYGVVKKHHLNYIAVTSSLFKGICEYADVPYQDYACRTDMNCGTTLGVISQRHVSVDSVDAFSICNAFSQRNNWHERSIL